MRSRRLAPFPWKTPWHWGSESDNLGVAETVDTKKVEQKTTRLCHVPKKCVYSMYIYIYVYVYMYMHVLKN